MNISVRFRYQIEDFKELVEADLGTKLRRRQLTYIVLGLVVLAVPFLYGRGLLHPDRDGLPLIPLGLLLLIGGVSGTYKAALQPYQAHADDTEYETTIDDTGIMTASSTSRTELKWETFSRVIRGNNVVALVCKSVMYAYPKRAFSDEQWAEFMEQIRTRVGNRDPSLRSE
jgi:hypothetical protein